MQWQAAENDVLTCKTTWGYQYMKACFNSETLLHSSGIRTSNSGKKRFQLPKPEDSAGHYNCDTSDPCRRPQKQSNLADNVHVSTKGCGGVCRSLLCVFLPTCAYFIKNIQNSQSSARQTRFCFQAEKNLDAKFWGLLLARLHHLLQFFLFTRKYSYLSFGLSSSALVSGAAVDRQRRERRYGGSGAKKFRYSTAR